MEEAARLDSVFDRRARRRITAFRAGVARRRRGKGEPNADEGRRWYVVRKWTSLASTPFVPIACVTGQPLVFHHEMEHDGPRPGVVETSAPLPALMRPVRSGGGA